MQEDTKKWTNLVCQTSEVEKLEGSDNLIKHIYLNYLQYSQPTTVVVHNQL